MLYACCRFRDVQEELERRMICEPPRAARPSKAIECHTSARQCVSFPAKKHVSEHLNLLLANIARTVPVDTDVEVCVTTTLHPASAVTVRLVSLGFRSSICGRVSAGSYQQPIC